jgi:hypothetical protein
MPKGRRRGRTGHGLALLVCLAAAGSAAPARAASGSGPALEAFQGRIQAYLEERERAAAQVPPAAESASPAQVTARELALGEALRRERAGARAGDLFGPAEEPVRRILREDWERRSAAERAGLLDEAPALAAPAVNSAYPAELPLLTMPAILLERLPVLPEQLEYRLFGRHLILRDVDANLVVDVLAGALPLAPAQTSSP